MYGCGERDRDHRKKRQGRVFNAEAQREVRRDPYDVAGPSGEVSKSQQRPVAAEEHRRALANPRVGCKQDRYDDDHATGAQERIADSPSQGRRHTQVTS
jgi:hypothetical protein